MSSPPDIPAAPSSQKASATPVVAAVVVAAGAANLGETLAAIAKQVYAPAQLLVVGATEVPQGATGVEQPEKVVGALDEGIRFIWWLHGDSRPRPDALSALLRETIRNDASLAGSKILEGEDQLESVGAATDAFGEPYTGLDPGELDLEQYDVVREVASVSLVSLLVRRDILRGLGGFDHRMPTQAAGLDLSQRTRLAGGRVIVVPSSEVFHHSPCFNASPGWKEQAGRQKAMLVAYRPLTLAWVVPTGGLVGLLDGLGQLVLGRIGPLLGTLASWLSTISQLPSVFSGRRRLAAIRSVGDEELFRFQVSGSARLRRTMAEIGDRFNRALDEDERGSLADRAAAAWRRPSAAWGVVSALFLLVASRGAWFAGLPQSGFTLPPGGLAGLAASYGGGFNPAGFGGGPTTPPLVGFSALVSTVLGRRPILAGALLTLAAAALALTGMSCLVRRAGAGSVGSAVAGWAYLAAATAIAVFESGNWPALLAAGPLPWALDPVLASPTTEWRRRIGRLAAGGIAAGFTAVAYPPMLVLIPLVALSWAAASLRPGAIVAGLAITALGAGMVAPFVVGGNLFDLLGAGMLPMLANGPLWLGVLLTAMTVSALWTARSRLPGIWLAASLIGLGLLGSRLPEATVGLVTIGLLAVALGAGLVAAVVVETTVPRFRFLGPLLGALLLVPALLTLGQGRLGLPPDQWSNRLEFINTLNETETPGRALLIGPPGSLPGQARTAFGFDYRVVDGGVATIAEAYLSQPGDLDAELANVVEENLLGAIDLRPGASLSRLGIGWVVVVPGSTFPTENLNRQVDLAERPLSTQLLVYQNLVDPVPNPGGDPASDDPLLRSAGLASAALFLVLIGAAIWGRGRPTPPAPRSIPELELAVVS